MNKEIGIAIIIAICVLILLIGLLKRKAEIILNFIVRIVVGVVAIGLTNELLHSSGSTMGVGVNPYSIATLGVLGLGGYGLLYGIMLYQSI